MPSCRKTSSARSIPQRPPRPRDTPRRVPHPRAVSSRRVGYRLRKQTTVSSHPATIIPPEAPPPIPGFPCPKPPTKNIVIPDEVRDLSSCRLRPAHHAQVYTRCTEAKVEDMKHIVAITALLFSTIPSFAQDNTVRLSVLGYRWTTTHNQINFTWPGHANTSCTGKFEHD